MDAKKGVVIGLGLVIILGFAGWIMNIVKLAGIVSEPLSGMMILRGIGVVLAPLGAILGWC
jgi:hypothetical protein